MRRILTWPVAGPLLGYLLVALVVAFVLFAFVARQQAIDDRKDEQRKAQQQISQLQSKIDHLQTRYRLTVAHDSRERGRLEETITALAAQIRQLGGRPLVMTSGASASPSTTAHPPSHHPRPSRSPSPSPHPTHSPSPTPSPRPDVRPGSAAQPRGLHPGLGGTGRDTARTAVRPLRSPTRRRHTDTARPPRRTNPADTVQALFPRGAHRLPAGAVLVLLRAPSLPTQGERMLIRRMPFVQAANYTRGRLSKPRLIVLHDMEAPETATTAEGVAQFFAHQPKSPNGSSAHVCVDDNSEVRCVHDRDTAWAAPNANHDGLHIEQAGYARQSRKDWLDTYSRHVIHRAAKQAARWCVKHKIRPYPLSNHELHNGVSGITTHLQVTAVLNNGQGHTDPGQHYPLDVFVQDLHHELRKTWRGRRLLRRSP